MSDAIWTTDILQMFLAVLALIVACSALTEWKRTLDALEECDMRVRVSIDDFRRRLLRADEEIDELRKTVKSVKGELYAMRHPQYAWTLDLKGDEDAQEQ